MIHIPYTSKVIRMRPGNHVLAANGTFVRPTHNPQLIKEINP